MRFFPALLITICCVLLAAPAWSQQRVLVVGDSLSIPLGEQLKTYYSLQSGVDYMCHGKVSSGLVRPDFYNWERVLDELAGRQRPDVLVVMLGTNDFKPLKTRQGSLRFGSTDWNREYARRVQRLISIARYHAPHSEIYWVGAPVMGKPDLNRAVTHINKVIAHQLGRNSRCRFIDTSAALADAKGRFIEYAPLDSGGRIRLRAKDGVHLTGQGAALLADSCLSVLAPGSEMMLANAAQKPRLQAAVAHPAPQPRKPAPKRDNPPPMESLPLQVAAASGAVSGQVAGNHAKVPRPAKTSKTKPVYVIQESSWSNKKEALRRASQLRAKGLKTHVETADLGKKGIWHRVMIGGYSSLERAKRQKDVLVKRYAISHTIILRQS